MKGARQKFTKILVTIVGILGLISTTLLLSDPPAPSDLNPSLFNLSEQIGKSGRQVASLELSDPFDAMFEINCDDESPKFETKSARFRLKGRTCTDESVAHSTQVQNKSNGFVATVFHRDPQSFTTDYINLNQGVNEISVVFDTGKGTVSKNVIVQRSPASL